MSVEVDAQDIEKAMKVLEKECRRACRICGAEPRSHCRSHSSIKRDTRAVYTQSI